MSLRTSLIGLSCVGFVGLWSGPAGAEGPDVDITDTPDGALPMTPADWVPEPGIDADMRPHHIGAKILFINFDGADMQFCGNNSPQGNCSTIFQGVVEPYTGDQAKRAAVVQSVRQRLADFGITTTDTRPASGDYDMEMVGNWQGAGQQGFAGVAPSIDCFDNNGGEVSFTLEATGTSDGIGEIILQEVAHTWGLEHVDEQTDLLYPTTQGTLKQFRDTCYKTVSDTDLTPNGGICNSVHTMNCDSAWQNSYREMLFLFGETLPDTIAPTVSILYPTEGAEVPPDFELLIGFADDQTPAVINATIVIDGAALEAPVELVGAYASPLEAPFPINGLPSGDYTVSIDATDEEDNPANDMVQFSVMGEDPPMGDESEGDSNGDEDSGDAGDSNGDDNGDSNGDGSDGESSGDGGLDGGGGSEEDGCGCSPSRPVGFAAGLPLLLLAFMRRRRAV